MGRCARPTRALATLLLLIATGSGAKAVTPSAPVGIGAGLSHVRLDRVVVRLGSQVSRLADRARLGGFAAAMADPRAASLDQALKRCGARRLRRVFRSFEDAGGALVDTARARAARLRSARQRRLPPTPDPPPLEDYFVADIDPVADLRGLDAVLSDLRSTWGVAAAQPDFVYGVQVEPLPDSGLRPDDPFVSMDGATWSEGAFGNDFPDLYGVRNVRALEAWGLFDTDGNGQIDGGEIGPGEGVVVAVIDTGLDVDHPDIADNVWVNPGEIPGNGIDDDGNGLVDDVNGWDFVDDDDDPSDRHGHGTHVAGTIAAPANGEGIVGIAPFARIMALKGLSNSGSGSSSSLAPAIDYATAQMADVTSNSWGGVIVDALIADAFLAAEASGVLNVAAAGNDGSGRLLSPALLDSTVAVAAVDADDVLTGFSNFGPGTDLGAPGRRVLSLSANDHANVIAERDGNPNVGARYMAISGTSMATPHVSGSAALLMALYPDESAAEIRGRLRGGAANVDAVNPGREGAMGSGRLDVLGSGLAVPRPLVQLQGVRVSSPAAVVTRTLELDLVNLWASASRVTLQLSSLSPLVRIRNGFADLGPLGAGERTTARFPVRARDLAPGSEVQLELSVEDGEGGEQTVPVPFRSPFFEDATEGSGWVPSTFLARSATASDFTGDGATDFAIGEFLERMRLFRNGGGLNFTVRRQPGSRGLQPLFIDVDGDGDRDLFGASSDPLLLRNEGGGEFGPSIPIEAGFRTLLQKLPIDLEGDQDIDVILISEEITSRGRAHVLENDGTGSFSLLRQSVGFDRLAFLERGLVALDYDDDGDTDVIGHGRGTEGAYRGIEIYANDGQGRFALQADAVPVASCPGFSKCTGATTLAAGDYDNDGDIDLLVAGGNFAGEQPALLYQNQGDGSFVDVTAEAGDLLSTNFVSGFSGTDFFDLDNDGDLDLFVSFDNVVLGTPERSFLPTNALFLNEGDGSFRLASDTAFPVDRPLAAFHAAMGDFDGDGGIDLLGAAGSVIIEVGGVFRNVAPRGSWIELSLQATRSPTDGLGARILAYADGRIHRRDVHYGAMDMTLVHIGLGAAEEIDLLEVYWPSGIVQQLRDVPVNERRALREMETDCGAGADSDQDGVCDDADNCILRANGPHDASSQGDADGDGYGDVCDPDLDNDGLVTLRDVAMVLEALGSSEGEPGYLPVADLDADGSITRADADRVISRHDSAPGPSGVACDPAGGAACPED